MRHLSEADLLDVAEGTQEERAHPHLASCDECRAQLSGLRAMLSSALEASVPEPSPLFWDQLSARVRERITKEEATRRPLGRALWATWRFALPAAGLAAVMLGALVSLRTPAPAVIGPPASAPSAEVERRDDEVLDADDPSLTFIAEIAGELDWDAAAEAGLTTSAGALERVLLELTADERLELQRILKQELAGQGA
jgi:hypothetical protein